MISSAATEVECTNAVLATAIIIVSFVHGSQTRSTARLYAIGAGCALVPLLADDLFAISAGSGLVALNQIAQDAIRNLMTTAASTMAVSLSVARFRVFSGTLAPWYTRPRYIVVLALMLLQGAVVATVTLLSLTLDSGSWSQYADILTTGSVVLCAVVDLTLTVATFLVIRQIEEHRKHKGRVAGAGDNGPPRDHRHMLVSMSAFKSGSLAPVESEWRSGGDLSQPLSLSGHAAIPAAHESNSHLSATGHSNGGGLRHPPSLNLSHSAVKNQHRQFTASLAKLATDSLQAVVPFVTTTTIWRRLVTLTACMAVAAISGLTSYLVMEDDPLRTAMADTAMHLFLACVVAQWRLVLALIMTRHLPA
ncbi:hypothetical protein BC828DRAFT_376907 [Blastocladiella britannica]|nr:hypothetical protein BC828DRAFT_376907 [Blastocladiella britannica]